MFQPDSEFWAKARRARDQLIEQLFNRPEVTLIDIGFEGEKNKLAEQLVLRVHVRQAVDKQALGLPDEINGLPVRLVVGEYRLQ